ncbi:MAG: hypothetical protein RBR32_07810 [Bacteroidales bacterium]|nr:hypothetical protein [Bacteroidales bacterium]
MEIEKIFSGASGNVQDTSGVSQGILAHWLTWMNETEGKTDRIIVVTANSLTGIPPEFIGRFDTVFFVGFPNNQEKKQIIEIMNKRYGSTLPTNNEFVNSLDRWTGREIERLARESLFYKIEDAIKYIPLVKNTKEKEIREMEKFATQVRHASKPDEKKEGKRSILTDSDKEKFKQKLKIKKKED